MAEIQLKNVTKKFGDFVALENISLTIEDASFTSIFGPPSSGKSVLLRVLLGLENIDGGQILIDGKDVTNAPPIERNLAIVFQNLALFPHLTAKENITFPMRRRKTHQDMIGERLDRLASVLNIAHILHKKPAALSGGERQRVAIGRALIRDANAYMMDEPIAALDARLRDTMRVELKRLQTELGQTFIYVTHDCDEAMSVADKMVILEQGRIAQIDKPDAIYEKPDSLYVAQLVGSPTINVLPAQMSGRTAQFAFGALNLPRSIDADAAYVALRPEIIELNRKQADSSKAAVVDIEQLGSFSIITVEAQGEKLRAINADATEFAVGEIVGVTIPVNEVMLFDRHSGQRI